MASRILALIVSVFLFATYAASSGDVVVLTSDNFDALTASGAWMIEFYAPWCGHCKKLEPIWTQLANDVADANVNVGKVDCTVEKDLAQRFGIRGYPTIKLLRDGKLYDYKGARNVETFSNFAREGYASGEGQTIPQPNQKVETPVPTAIPVSNKNEDTQSSVTILTDANFEQLTATGKWMVKFYAPWCGHCKRLVPTWEELATKAASDFSVGKVDCTVHPALCQKYGVKGYPTLKLFGNSQKHDYSGPRTLEAFMQFAKGGYEAKAEVTPATSAVPPVATESKVVTLSTNNFEQELASGSWLLEFYAPWCGHCKKLVPVWEELATKSGDVKIGKIDCTVEKDLAQRFGIRGYPTIKFVHSGTVYAYSGPRTTESFLAFASDGYKSAPGTPFPSKGSAAKDEL